MSLDFFSPFLTRMRAFCRKIIYAEKVFIEICVKRFYGRLMTQVHLKAFKEKRIKYISDDC